MRVEPVIERLWQFGDRFKIAFNEAARRHVDAELRGLPPRWTVHFTGDQPKDPILGASSVPWRTLWSQEMCRRGVLANFGLSACYALSDFDVERVCEAIEATLGVMGGVDDPTDALVGPASAQSVRAA